MQIGDRYIPRGIRGTFKYEITGVFNTVDQHGNPHCEVEFVYWDSMAVGAGKRKHRDSKDKFLHHCEPDPMFQGAGQVPPAHPMNVMGLGGGQLDALAASMRSQFNEAIAGAKSFRTPIIDDKPKCDCGGKACGYKDYTRQHSSWCKVYKE